MMIDHCPFCEEKLEYHFGCLFCDSASRKMLHHYFSIHEATNNSSEITIRIGTYGLEYFTDGELTFYQRDEKQCTHTTIIKENKSFSSMIDLIVYLNYLMESIYLA